MGKRNLEIAITRAGSIDVVVNWVPFILRENTPEEGIPKKGPIGKVNSDILEMGRAIWIEFTGLCPRVPNTLRAHALMAYAREVGSPADLARLQDIIFRKYFTDGIFLDLDALVSACGEAGLSEEDGRRALEDRRFEDLVRKEAAEAVNLGISGVPTFFIGEQRFSGPQSPEVFQDAFQRACRT